MNECEMFTKSILIVSHPDDEILWFSSIVDKVDEIIFCYSDIPSNQKWTIGRKQSLSEYPMKNISCLGIDEPEAFNSNNWQNPVLTEFGIKIFKRIPNKKYKENYSKITKVLKDKLTKYDNVFTHNPWGEYGNEEHIQIYRIVKKYQEKRSFNLWFSNYCSNRSYPLMLKYISGVNSEYITFRTNKELSNTIKNLYVKNGCWTWYDDWIWFNEESFMNDKELRTNNREYGRFPLNMIKEECNTKGFAKIKLKMKEISGWFEK
jgi:hypothetical protein